VRGDNGDLRRRKKCGLSTGFTTGPRSTVEPETDLRPMATGTRVGESAIRLAKSWAALSSDPIDRHPEDRRERARSALAAAFGRSRSRR